MNGTSSMSKLRTFQKLFSRCMQTSRPYVGAPMPPMKTEKKKQLIVESLDNRELVRVRGEDVVPFLQGLITNDMSQLQSGHATSMYAMFLNKGGRVLYDSIIYATEKPNTYLLECDKSVSNDFRRLLRMYRVRRKIEVDSMQRDYSTWCVFSPNQEDKNIVQLEKPRSVEDVFSTPDPRLPTLGTRLITSKDKSWKDLSKTLAPFGSIVRPSNSGYNYNLHRYRFGIAEGVGDLPPGKCFPLEANCDFLHGVSFQKGCYIGQELTARVYHTGVVRKRLMPLRVTAAIKERDATVQTIAGAPVGTIRGASHDRALALVRVDQAFKNRLMIDGSPCYAETPSWWPHNYQRKAVAAAAAAEEA